MAAVVDRYKVPTSTSGDGIDVMTSAQGTGTTAQTGATTTNQSQQTSTNQTQTTDQTTRNLSKELEGQLNALVAQLAAGGTPQMQQDRAQRIAQIQRVIQQQEQYSKASAFGDAQGLIAQQMRRTLEGLLPSINRASEDAGSSGGALRALLLQDAANKAAESSSALGVQTAAQYGGINANLMQVLEGLTRPDATVANSLISAVNAGKGAVQQTTGTTNTSGYTDTTTQGTQNTNTNTATATQENKVADYAPFQVSTTPQFFGALDNMQFVDPAKYVGSSAYNMAQLQGLGSTPWSSYQF